MVKELLKNNAVWVEGAPEINKTFAFQLKFLCQIGDKIQVKLIASDTYRLFLNGELRGYGPARAAKCFERLEEYAFFAQNEENVLTVEQVAYHINTMENVNKEPFFSALIYINGELRFLSGDFSPYALTDRLQKVQRYSVQRAMVEAYHFDSCRSGFYQGKENSFPVLALKKATCQEIRPRGVGYFSLTEYKEANQIESGCVFVDEKATVWRGAAITEVPKTFEGFAYDELEAKVTDKPSLFRYKKEENASQTLKALTYRLFDLERIYAGLINVRFKAIEDSEIYLIFDELDWTEERLNQTAKNVSFYRMTACNVIKIFAKKGAYNFISFSAYDMRYIKIVLFSGKIEVEKVGVIKQENDKAQRLTYEISDQRLKKILSASQNNFAQNVLDIFMDCPSRERAGWINDSYFTSLAESLYAGCRLTERNFIENIVAEREFSFHPKGMLPMCYPADHSNGLFSPTCALWFALQTIRYLAQEKDETLEVGALQKIEELLQYFKPFENEEGLLEDLDGWVFIEWSKANDPEYTKGVNFPANMLYYAVLKGYGELTGNREIVEKARALKETILERSFNGEVFEDNCVRENGVLVLKGHHTESCQYFAIHLGLADGERFKEYREYMIENLSPLNRQDRYGLDKPNIIVGFLLREEILMAEKKTELMKRELVSLFLPMAERTGTLWENIYESASCNHGLMAVVGRWIVYILTGFKGIENGQPIFDIVKTNIDCKISVPMKSGALQLIVNNGKLKINVLKG